MRRILIATVSLMSLGGHALAQEANGLQIGLGAGVAPDYEGSDEYRFVPLPSFDARYEGFGIRTSRLGVEADLIPYQGFELGPVVRYNMGRDNVRDDVVDLLPEVDGSVELGGYIGAGIPLSVLGGGSDTILFGKLSGVQGLGGGHGGAVFEASVGFIAPVTSDLTLITSLSSSYMSSDYADAFFSVSPAGAAASGLAAYDASAGFKDVGASLILRKAWTENWSTTLIGSYTRLVGQAADSPVVADRGSADQFFAGLSLGYRF